MIIVDKITSASRTHDANSIRIDTNDGQVIFTNEDNKYLQKWLALDPANVITDFVPPTPPTNDQIYESLIQSNKVLKSLVLCINDGSIVPGSNVSPAQLKQAIKSNM